MAPHTNPASFNAVNQAAFRELDFGQTEKTCRQCPYVVFAKHPISICGCKLVQSPTESASGKIAPGHPIHLDDHSERRS